MRLRRFVYSPAEHCRRAWCTRGAAEAGRPLLAAGEEHGCRLQA